MLTEWPDESMRINKVTLYYIRYVNISTGAWSACCWLLPFLIFFKEYLRRRFLRVLWTALALRLPFLTLFDSLGSVRLVPTLQSIHHVRRHNKQQSQSALFLHLHFLDFEHLSSRKATGFKRVQSIKASGSLTCLLLFVFPNIRHTAKCSVTL